MTWRIRSVRKRILLLALVPLLSLFGLYVFGTSITARNAINLARADTLKHATGQPTGTFDGMIQAEPLLAVLYLAAPTPENQAKRTAIEQQVDRKSTRLNSSHVRISYAVFCLKKKTKKQPHIVNINKT